MQKIVIILLLFITTISCSVLKQQKSAAPGSSNEVTRQNLFEVVRSGNLSGDNYLIQKATVAITDSGEEEKFIVIVKYLKTGIYLISLRNRTGIEAARIYMTGDTILANDRINRKLISAEPGYLLKRYGITTEVLPVLIGDLVGVKNEYISYSDCINGTYESVGFIKGIKLNYKIDCSKGKVIFVRRESSTETGSTEIRFDDFFEQQNFLIPGKISIKNTETNSIIVIEINKIELFWTGGIEFIPGNGYEKVNLQ